LVAFKEEFQITSKKNFVKLLVRLKMLKRVFASDEKRRKNNVTKGKLLITSSTRSGMKC